MKGVKESLERLAVAEERVAAAIERLVEMSRVLVADSARSVAGRTDRESPIMAAIRIYVDEGGGSVTEIAQRVGVSRSKLYAHPAFQEAKRRVDRGNGDGIARSAVRADEM